MSEKGLILALNEGRERVTDPRSQYALVKEINKELQEMDRFLSVVFVSEKAPEGIIPGLVPGRWHVRRSQPGIIDSYWSIVGENDSYRDLGKDLIEMMKANDLWTDGALEKLNKAKYYRAERKARAEALVKEQRLDHLSEDLRAMKRVFGEGGMFARKQFQG